MFDPFSLLLSAMLTFSAGSPDPGYTDNTRAVIIDTGSPGTEQPPPPPDDQARSQIIDLG